MKKNGIQNGFPMFIEIKNNMKKIIKKIVKKLPIISNIIHQRNIIESERNNLKNENRELKLLLENNQKRVGHQIIKSKNVGIDGVNKYIKNAKAIFDVGTGPNGSPWWSQVQPETKIVGIDMYFFPTSKPKNVSVYKYDASNLNKISGNQILEKHIADNKFKKETVNLKNKFDLVIANHVLEHVSSPENTIKGISKLIKKNGVVYVGVPDGFNFTDIFYHIVHPENGGHIQRLVKKDLIKIFEKNGLKLISEKVWPDDWLWFEKCYDYKGRGIQFIDALDIEFIANTFRKELTPQKGYYYGWELVFQKL